MTFCLLEKSKEGHEMCEKFNTNGVSDNRRMMECIQVAYRYTPGDSCHACFHIVPHTVQYLSGKFWILATFVYAPIYMISYQ